MHQGLRLYILTYIRICSSDGLKYVVSRFEHWLTRSQILYKYFEKKEKERKEAVLSSKFEREHDRFVFCMSTLRN